MNIFLITTLIVLGLFALTAIYKLCITRLHLRRYNNESEFENPSSRNHNDPEIGNSITDSQSETNLLGTLQSRIPNESLESLFMETLRLINDIIESNATRNLPINKQSLLTDFNIKKDNLYSNIPKIDLFNPKLEISIFNDNILKSFEKSFMEIDPYKFLTSLMSILIEDESVMDSGAIIREYLEKAIKQILDPKFGLFVFNSNQSGVYPLNMDSGKSNYYKVLGRQFARLIIDRNVVDFNMENIVFKAILGRKIEIQDFKKLNEAYYDGLMVTARCLEDVTLHFIDSNGLPLKPRGEFIEVNAENVDEFIELSLKKKYLEGLTRPCELIAEGLFEILHKDFFKDWSPEDLNLLLSGRKTIDVEDWRLNTIYEEFKASDETILWFWEIVGSLSEEDKSKLLHFASGSSRVSEGGFGDLYDFYNDKIQFKLKKVNFYKLPEAHACFFRMDMAEYETKEKLEKDILFVIQHSHEDFTLE